MESGWLLSHYRKLHIHYQHKYYVTSCFGMWWWSQNCGLAVHFILQSALRQVRSLFQSEFSKKCDLELPFSGYRTVSLLEGHSVAAYTFFFVFPSLLPYPVSFLSQPVPEGSSHTSCDQSSWPSFFLLSVGYSSSPWLPITLFISHTIGTTDLLHPSPEPHFQTSQVLLIYLRKWLYFKVKWSEVKWSEVKWSEVKWSEVKWSEVKWLKWSELRWRSCG